MDEDGNGGLINPVGGTGDQIVSGPIEEIVQIMDKNRAGGEISPEGDTGDQTVLGPTEDWSSVVERRCSQAPTLLRASAGQPACCIFRVPRSLATTYEKAFKPQIVSIGPYHHGRECTKMVEEHKARYFTTLVARTNDRGVHLNDYFKSVASKEEEIRECYSEPLELGRSDLVEMMVLDGCFVIEWLRLLRLLMGSEKKPNQYDPIINFPGIYPLVMTDLIQLENQIPFFVLNMLYELSKSPEESCNLQTLVLDLYNVAFGLEEQQMRRYRGISNSTHLLQLLHSSFADFPTASDVTYPYQPLDYSAKELKRAGIKFKPRMNTNFLHFSFTNGVLQVPLINLDFVMVAFLSNCFAFEQAGHMRMSQNISCYVTLLGIIISDSEDAALLSKLQIVKDQYFGSNDAIARFFWDMGQETMLDVRKCYLAKLLLDMDEYRKDQWHLRLTRMKWLIVSSVGAMVLLVLTVIQSTFAVLAYFRPPK